MKGAAALLLVVCLPGAALCEETWNTVKSTHFVVSYRHAPLEFAERVSSEAERWYATITDDLGFLRHDFWLWDNRAQITIYDSERDYLAESGMPAWSSGATAPKDKVVYAFYGKEGFFEHVLPHEIGHIIFREFVGFDNPAVPLWLDEGAASYHEIGGNIRAVLAREMKNMPSLDRLSVVDPHAIGDQRAAALFYAEAAGVIDFLLRTYGKESFVLFCRSLRDTRELDRALSYAFSIQGGIAELDRLWRAYYKE
jgi:hypothetical protein